MSIKKYTNGSWTPASYRKYGTETDAITTLPATIIGDGTPISSYTIKGNMEQNGTPTPSSPIYPSECGERTANLFDKDQISANTYINSSGNTAYGSNAFVSDKIPVFGNKEYCLQNLEQKFLSGYYVAFYDEQDNVLSVIDPRNWNSVILTAPIGSKYFMLSGNLNITLTATTFIEGSTAPTSYIPYGYKLPLTLGSTTTDIYLGEVQSTRRVKKLVLDGTENEWEKSLTHAGCFALRSIGTGVTEKTMYCTHATFVSTASQLTSNNTCYMGNDFNIWLDLFDAQTTNEQFKTYLQQQYASGTPVTVWYVLAEPETAVVNEPIRKIGDYVDSVSGTGLVTSGTAQELNIETTLKPSEVDMTYHGWHEHDDTKYST